MFLQSSLGKHRGEVLGPATDTKIPACSSVTVSLPYPLVCTSRFDQPQIMY